jgi:TetR/AcrR family transcriptional regulator, transcriptional repressor for nem operon
MSKGEETKEKILQQAAELFNQQGYAGASIADIMRVTGLQKGGIYNHFQSKDDLALQAFDFAVAQFKDRYRIILRSKYHAIDRLQAIVDIFRSNIDNPIVKGGCPILNTAIESDDTHPALRERAKQAMNSWREMVSQIIQKGIERGEIRPTVNIDEIATIMISSLEGAVMMSKLYGDLIYIERVSQHLNEYIKNHVQI